MKHEITVCERCNRSIGHVEQQRELENHTLCLPCYDMLTQGTPAGFITVRCTPYAWLKFPAILMGVVGLSGILAHKFETVAAKLSFLNMPPQGSCYLITAGAIILLGISILYKQSKREIIFAQGNCLETEENWRSV